jgi:hypothetical protein
MTIPDGTAANARERIREWQDTTYFRGLLAQLQIAVTELAADYDRLVAGHLPTRVAGPDAEVRS